MKNSLFVVINSFGNLGKIVLETLSRPVNLCFWWGETERVFAISAVNEPTEQSVAVPNYFYKTRNGSKIKNYLLLKAIKTLTGWENGSLHHLVGEFIPEINMIVFHTEDTEMEGVYEQ